MARTTAWKCQVCGYVHRGAEPPEECPVCGAPQEAFEPHEEAAASHEKPQAEQWRCLNCNYV
ncbi:pyridine nucleotide-disulfide oxidoreductase, partial [bacterium]|nr:pyridine nucleotide-disulfide oxidoreductase [bacterium]